MKDSANPRWLKAKARELARDAADAGLARARDETAKRRKTDAEEELGRDEAESANVDGRSSDNARSEHVEPSSSKDHVKRPAASEEGEEAKKRRAADPAGQKRKQDSEIEAATTPSPSKEIVWRRVLAKIM